MQLSDDALVGGVAASVGSFFVWLIRLAFKQAMDRFDKTMKLHADSISANTRELSALREEITEQRVTMADFAARLKAVERDAWEDGK